MLLTNWISVRAWTALALILLLGGCPFSPSGVTDDQPDGGSPPIVMPDAAIDAPDPAGDEDGDGILNANDNCPGEHNPDQADFDFDDWGDKCDNCTRDPNEDQADTDSDGVGDICDNCKMDPNESQENSDFDDHGNACDNCAGEVNNDQADEDGDGRGDVCDLCPTRPKFNESDADGDGVGDACDPRPNVGGDEIVFIEGFNQDSPGIPEGWAEALGPDNASGTWSVSNGSLKQTDATSDPATLFLSSDKFAVPDDVVVEAIVTLDSVPAPSAVNRERVAVLARYTDGPGAGSAGDDGYLCGSEQQSFGGSDTRLRIESSSSGADTKDTDAFSLTSGVSYRIVHYQHDDNIVCTVAERDNDAAGDKDFNCGLSGPGTGQIGLQTQRIQASINAVVVYAVGGRPSECPSD